MTSIRFAVAVAILATVSTVVAQGPRRDGRWEVTMQMEMPGLPAGVPPMKTTQCITKEEADDPNKAVPQGPTDNPNDCKVSDHKVDGNKVSWKMQCRGQQPMTGTGEMAYSADTFIGTMKMDMPGHSMTIKYNGKRLGDCVK